MPGDASGRPEPSGSGVRGVHAGDASDGRAHPGGRPSRPQSDLELGVTGRAGRDHDPGLPGDPDLGDDPDHAHGPPADRPRHALAGVALVLTAAALWGLLGIFGTYGRQAGLSAYDVAWWRAASGAALFGLHALVIRARFPRGRDLATTAVYGLVSGAVFYAAYQVAVAAGGAALASVLLYTAPAFVALLGIRVLHERLGPIEVGAVAASIVGVGLVALGGGSGVTVTLFSLATGLLAGFTYSLVYLYGRAFYQRYHPSACLSVALTVAVAALTPVTTPAVWSPDTLGRAWPAILGIGPVSTYVAYVCHSAGLQRVPATRASVLATIEPVVAVALAAALFGEHPAALAVVGGIVVIGAAATLAVAPRRA